LFCPLAELFLARIPDHHGLGIAKP
jgi:hypothetical protein